jgi:hypothetical protein
VDIRMRLLESLIKRLSADCKGTFHLAHFESTVPVLVSRAAAYISAPHTPKSGHSNIISSLAPRGPAKVTPSAISRTRFYGHPVGEKQIADRNRWGGLCTAVVVKSRWRFEEKSVDSATLFF